MEKLKKNQKFKSTVVDLYYDGNGVAKCDGLVVFIPGVLKGEEVEGVIINAKSKYVVGKAQEIINKSQDRIEPLCPYFLKCGGCNLQHMKYSEQLKFKKQQIQKLLGDDVNVEDTFASNEYRYRNKVALPVGVNGDIGFYRLGSHNIVPVTDCPICGEFVKPLIQAANELVKNNMKIKHVVARELSGHIIITLVVFDKKDIDKEKTINVFDKFFNNYSINININKLDNNVILSDKFINLKGDDSIEHKSLDVVTHVSNGSFFQVNQSVSEEIYKQVLANIDNNSVVIDCYSGAGLMTAILAKRAKKCYGIEIVKSATEDANKLKKENNILNMENINGDCAEVLPKLAAKLLKEKVNMVVDPPRKGVDKKVLETIISVKPDKIIYVSCNPATLARDAEIIKQAGYSIAFAKGFDMFPQTHHVETLCVFIKPKVQKKVVQSKPNFKDKYFNFYDDIKIASNDEW